MKENLIWLNIIVLYKFIFAVVGNGNGCLLLRIFMSVAAALHRAPVHHPSHHHDIHV